jgi:heme/copper-type cytochrome/quinol oxidase subunit 2
MKPIFKIASVIVAVLLTTGIVIALYYGHFLDGGNTQTNTNSIHFTIVISENGFNGSVSHGSAQWPIMNVHKGQSVIVHVEETSDSVQPHGFAIDHYLVSGIILRPGESHDVAFTADQTGTFRVFCNIFCTIHPYMQNGLLNVTS